MAEHTSSSITIEAAPADVMAVIADFARYPDWTGEVKEAEVLATDGQGRAEQVRLVMDAGAIKDDQTLGYTWTGGPRGLLDPGQVPDAPLPGRLVHPRPPRAPVPPRSPTGSRSTSRSPCWA